MSLCTARPSGERVTESSKSRLSGSNAIIDALLHGARYVDGNTDQERRDDWLRLNGSLAINSRCCRLLGNGVRRNGLALRDEPGNDAVCMAARFSAMTPC